jgi:hypothetical protein
MQKSTDVRRLWERALIVALLGSAVTGSACIGGGAERRATRDNQQFRETMREVARLPKYSHSDDKIADILMKATREQRLDPFIAGRQFVIETRDNGRKITCEYERTVEVFPGKTKKLLFKNEVDESFF